MNIEITIGGPLADAINALAAALQTNNLIERTAAKAAPKTKKESAAPAQEPAVVVKGNEGGLDETPAVPAAVSADPAITTYEQLRAHVAPLLANPATKPAVTKQIKKFCDGKLQDIKPEDYPALVAALKEITK